MCGITPDWPVCWRLSTGGALLIVWIAGACTSPPSGPEVPTSPAPTEGITGMTQGGPDLQVPPSTPEEETWIYQLGLPFQADQDTGGYFINIRVAGVKGTDFENGSDVVLFDNITEVSSEGAVPITRNHREPNPNSKPPNQEAIMVKYPVMGGFVPRGAKRPDSSPHPHAGTGFGINQAVAWRTEFPGPPPYGVNMFGRNPHTSEFEDLSQTYQYKEVHQLSYDGGSFQVVETERLASEDLLSGWKLNTGLMNAIPDGDDLILAMGGSREGQVGGSGMARWRRVDGKWQVVSFVPVTGSDGSFESSLIRDLDGDLLFACRGGRGPATVEASESHTAGNDIRVWRSQDNGETWEKMIHVRGLISSAPITLNRAADGTPFIAANLYQVFLEGLDRLKIPKDSQGRPVLGGRSRHTLAIWPLNRERTGLKRPIVARELRAEFGPAPGETAWRVDHPCSMILRLADGKWHNVVAMRILEYGELTHMQMPTKYSGAYLEEVLSAGEPIATWSF